jgi:hypothetical protein
MFIPDPDFSIPGPSSKGHQIRIRQTEFKLAKNFSIFNPKNYYKALRKMIWDPDPDFFPSRIRDQGSKKHCIPGPGSRSVTLLKC